MQNTNIAAMAVFLLSTTGAWANHPVFVEGNCLVPPAGSSSAPAPGTCGDYDGDGLIGTAEDNDGDRVFGTINAALGPGTAPNNPGANQNGQVTIVTSGVFAESVNITAANGNVTLQAAPGVEAVIDAVLQGDPDSTARQASIGIRVHFENADRYVILRNLTVRNWESGIQVASNARVAIENCRVENNVNFGIQVTNTARVKVDQCQIIATGRRVAPTSGDFPDAGPNMAIGVDFDGRSSGAVFRTEASGNVGAGIRDRSSGTVTIKDVYLFNNNPNLQGITPED